MSKERWTRSVIEEIYDRPILNLIFEAAHIHRQHHDPQEIQMSTLVSIKTGGCSEDCSYCPQAARYHTDIESHKLMDVEEVVEKARAAKDSGSSRLCMGAAWREVKDNADFDRIVEMVRSVNNLGLEVCCTLGMLTVSQAQKLADAGLYAYNHNVDTSPEYYDKIISTRSIQDRLETLENVRQAGLTVCSGGIIGMGETRADRVGMIHLLANLDPPPESIPINALVPVKGTPLESQKRVSVWELLRMIATFRIVAPESRIRLSAGRTEMSDSEQALCFLAGANSIFAGDKLLTTPNPSFESDLSLLERLNLKPAPARAHYERNVSYTTTS